MIDKKTYQASCHCGSVRFGFKSRPISSGRRCNCSICVRKGIVMSADYFAPEDVEPIVGAPFLSLYQFGDKDINHHFCRICGVSPFSTVATVPPSYNGPARPGYYRINLGCVDGLDVFALDVEVIDGRSL